MPYNLNRRLQVARFNMKTKKIFETPPIRIVSAPWSIVSMVGDNDVGMYILALKSFYKKLGSGNVTAIISKKMADSAVKQISDHFIGIELEFLEDIDVGPFQRGGTWERLIYIVQKSRGCYVLQLDCDTLTIGPDISEITNSIKINASYAYSDSNRPVKTLSDAGYEATASTSNYVGTVLERSFCNWPDARSLKYCRGSSAITGFAVASCDVAKLEFFHSNMKKFLGDRCREWGTEQCASNFMIANSPNVSILPFPAYSTYPGLGTDKGVKMYHFLGSVRYRDGYYARTGIKIIQDLLA